MAGLGFTLTQDAISPSLAHLAGQPLQDRIALAAATALVGLAQRAFDEPDLRPSEWAPRKKPASHPLLLLSGTLRQSIHAVSLGGGKADIKMPVEYAAHQQLGSRKTSGRGSGVPPRPFFPALDGQITERGYEAIDDVVDVLIGKAGR